MEKEDKLNEIMNKLDKIIKILEDQWDLLQIFFAKKFNLKLLDK